MKFLRIQEKKLKRVSKECMRSHTKCESGMLGRCMTRVGFLERGMSDAHNVRMCFINYQMAQAAWPKRLQDRTMAKLVSVFVNRATAGWSGSDGRETGERLGYHNDCNTNEGSNAGHLLVTCPFAITVLCSRWTAFIPAAGGWQRPNRSTPRLRRSHGRPTQRQSSLLQKAKSHPPTD
jgi:hypothetical protein